MTVEAFFERSFEKSINKNLFYRKYVLNKQEVIDYVDELLSIPLVGFVDYMIHHVSTTFLDQTSIVQYSSFFDATQKLCAKLEANGDDGFAMLEVGRMLLDDGLERKDVAYKKYGENHAKLGLELGLIQECYGYYYLSCLGKVYPDLDPIKQTGLIRRTILRNKLVQMLIKDAECNPVSIKASLSFLADSTIKRRLSNIKELFQIFYGGDDILLKYLSNIEELSLHNNIIRTVAPDTYDSAPVTFRYASDEDDPLPIAAENDMPH